MPTEILSKWPLFGSSFFAVKRSGDQQILALNRTGVHFLHIVTHVSTVSLPFAPDGNSRFRGFLYPFGFLFVCSYESTTTSRARVFQKTLSTVPFSEVISTRKVRAGEGATLYLELKCGNLFQQRVARLQTDQAHEIARLVRQYITMHRRKLLSFVRPK